MNVDCISLESVKKITKLHSYKEQLVEYFTNAQEQSERNNVILVF